MSPDTRDYLDGFASAARAISRMRDYMADYTARDVAGQLAMDSAGAIPRSISLFTRGAAAGYYAAFGSELMLDQDTQPMPRVR